MINDSISGDNAVMNQYHHFVFVSTFWNILFKMHVPCFTGSQNSIAQVRDHRPILQMKDLRLGDLKKCNVRARISELDFSRSLEPTSAFAGGDTWGLAELLPIITQLSCVGGRPVPLSGFTSFSSPHHGVSQPSAAIWMKGPVDWFQLQYFFQ